MDNRVKGWTEADAQVAVDYYWEEESYNELIYMSEWFPLPESGYDYVQDGYFTIGGYDSFGRDDDDDIMSIYLYEGETYSFFVGQEDPDGWDYIYPSLSLFDENGYLLRTQEGSSSFSAPYESSIINFTPHDAGWVFLFISSPYAWDSAAVVVVAAQTNETSPPPVVDVEEVVDTTPTPEPEPEPEVSPATTAIINPDTSNFDNAILSESGQRIDADDAMLYRMYLGGMDRVPDENGFQWWADEITFGDARLVDVATGFVFSSEFEGYADTNENGTVDNEEFVSHMYENVFGRAPDQSGYDFWINKLDSSKATQPEVFVSMTQSNEYVDITLEAVGDYLFI